jgi:hypothetical protein
MSANKKRVLLVNPWIYDFSAYDFWQKPLGLLYLGSLLRQQGYEVDLLDCLDRQFPLMFASNQALKKNNKKDGAGKYHREFLNKPDCLAEIPKNYCRYGTPFSLLESRLRQMIPPDLLVSGRKRYVHIVTLSFPQHSHCAGGSLCDAVPGSRTRKHQT